MSVIKIELPDFAKGTDDCGHVVWVRWSSIQAIYEFKQNNCAGCLCVAGLTSSVLVDESTLSRVKDYLGIR